MNSALKSVNYRAFTEYGQSLDDLCKKYINHNTPVIIWASIDMAEVRVSSTWIYEGKKIEWKTPEHCLVLVGYDSEYYYFNDPMRGKNVNYEKSKVIKAYKTMGMQAVVVKLSI